MKFIEELNSRIQERSLNLKKQKEVIAGIGKEIEEVTSQIKIEEEKYLEDFDIKYLEELEKLKDRLGILERNKTDRERFLALAEKKKYQFDGEKIAKDIDRAFKTSHVIELGEAVVSAQQEYFRLLEEMNKAANEAKGYFNSILANKEYLPIEVLQCLQLAYSRNTSKVPCIEKISEDFKAKEYDLVYDINTKFHSEFYDYRFKELDERYREISKLTGIYGIITIYDSNGNILPNIEEALRDKMKSLESLRFDTLEHGVGDSGYVNGKKYANQKAYIEAILRKEVIL